MLLVIVWVFYTSVRRKHLKTFDRFEKCVNSRYIRAFDVRLMCIYLFFGNVVKTENKLLDSTPFNLCFHVFPQLHARARRASFVVIICAAFLTVGSVTMTTTVRTTRMKGTVVSGGSLLAGCL